MIDIEKMKAEALEALDNLDDYARMEIGIEPIGAVNHLTNFINTVCDRIETEKYNYLGAMADCEELEAKLEAAEQKITEQAAVIENLRAVLENCRPVMESYSGTTRFNEFIAALAIPTDNKQVLAEYVQKAIEGMKDKP